MPRKPRSASDAPFHHVYSRGVAKQRIFHTVADVLAFLDLFAAALVATGARCLAWAIMKNHYHFVLACSADLMATVMHRTLGPYASRYNALNDRSGHLFGGRYGSVPIHDDTLLKTEIRYVIKNPYEAGVVSDVSHLEQYPWTSYPTLLGSDGPVPVAVDEVLALFGDASDVARVRLREWIATPTRRGETGEETAVRVIAEDVCRAHGLEVADLSGTRSRKTGRVRAAVVQELRDRLDVKDALIARILGVSRATVSRIPRLAE